jgi:ADP-ribose pyrophosphatase YjhB (NUDIX family)
MDEHQYLPMTEFKYCPLCASGLLVKKIHNQDRSVCEDCGYIWYKNPIPAAGAIIIKDNKVLLVKRKYDPQAGDWCLPAGFMENDESPIECCEREVKEETGLDIRVEKLFWNYEAGDDPRAKVVLILYLAEITGGELIPGDDAIEARFFPLDNLPPNIAFNAHVRALNHLKMYLTSGNLPVSD